MQLSWQQTLLDILQKGLSTHLQDPEFSSKLSLIKSLFYHRKYLEIFSNPSLLGIYSAEYIPHRALCYTELFLNLQDSLALTKQTQITCLGSGNGAEWMAVLMTRQLLSWDSPLSIVSHDLADYRVSMDLLGALQSKYPDSMAFVEWRSLTCNLISEPSTDLMDILSESSLVTCMFLLNELFAASKSGFASFLTSLIHTLREDSLLLVVDSAGSFSETQIGNHSHMIYKFLDGIQVLECLYSKDSVWYRVPQGLYYPTKLNNMRYYIRLFRKKSNL